MNKKWFVHDRDGREIYLTEEQWEHIINRHPELQNHLDEVLKTVQQGRRRQQPRDPQAYVYRWSCNTLRPPFNGILVVVVFRFEPSETGDLTPNNFIVTAWGTMMRKKR